MLRSKIVRKKVLVQFDGSNFYNKVKKIDQQVHLTTFNYISLAKSIAEVKPDKVIYYVGEIRQYEGNKKSETLYANQQKLFTQSKKPEHRN